MDIKYAEMLNIVNENQNEMQEQIASSEFLFDPKINFRLKENFNDKDYFEPTDGEYAPKGSLWNNPSINSLKSNLTSEQLEYFSSQGDNMYNYDFAKADIDAELKEITEYVIFGLKSGLNPSDMTDEEKDAMCEIYGPTWYIQYGFTEEEVYD